MKTNEELRKDVMDEIKWNPELGAVASDIGVTAKDGVVTLSGIVDTYHRKLVAEKSAQEVSGVRVVACDLEVKVNALGRKTDIEIAEAVKNALRWHSAVNEDKVEVKVDNGWVYLDGNVDWNYEKTTAQRLVEGLLGVRGVTNNIIINPRQVEAKEVMKKIAAAFHRSATIDSDRVQVELRGSKAILWGTVRSWTEREDAERAAASAPGIISVENHLKVDVEVYV